MRVLSITTVMLLVVAAGCSSDAAKSAETATTTTTATPTFATATATTARATTATTPSAPATAPDSAPDSSPDSSGAATRASATIAAAPQSSTPETTQTEQSTTLPTVSGGWEIAAGQFAAEVLAPIDISNWTGVPSPPLPALTGQPLADGIYAAEVAKPWNAGEPDTLDIKVIPIAECSTLASASSCVTDAGTPYMPTDLGIDRDNFYPVTVSLDDTIGVGVVGYGCAGDIDETGNGSDLAALFAAFETAYKRSILPQLKAGRSEREIMDAIRANPPPGFADGPATCGDTTTSYGLLYTAPGDAPPLLLQAVTGFDEASDDHIPLTATTAVHLNTVQVTHGVMTLYWYASFYP